MLDPRLLERSARLHTMRSFARALGLPEEHAAAVYERELEYVGAAARVERFVAIIAEKRAKAALREASSRAPFR